MKTAIVENSAPTHAPFSTVVYEQSLPDRHETGPDGQPRLLPRETLHHVYLRDVATGQQTRLVSRLDRPQPSRRHTLFPQHQHSHQDHLRMARQRQDNR